MTTTPTEHARWQDLRNRHQERAQRYAEIESLWYALERSRQLVEQQTDALKQLLLEVLSDEAR